MTSKRATAGAHSTAYELFILVLTILALGVMVGILLPLDAAVTQLLILYDNVICVVFLGDFVLRMRAAPSKRGYFFRDLGWLDLLGSIPSFGFFKYSSLLRLARINRLLRASRLIDPSHRRELIRDVIDNRGQYAAFITILTGAVVLVVASVVVLSAESKTPGANIITGGDALWWAIVTITTVGYGDEYPITTVGRLTAIVVMVAGVGIIGSLASILSSILVPPPAPEVPDAAGATTTPILTTPAPQTTDGGAVDVSALEAELRAIRAELVAIRSSIGNTGAGSAGEG